MRAQALFTSLGLGAGLFLAPASVQDPAPQVDALQAEVEALRSSLEVERGRVDQIEAYLQAQAKSMTAYERAVDAAVEKGYTAGINFESRQVLVEAWRKQVEAANHAVPGAKAATEADAKKR